MCVFFKNRTWKKMLGAQINLVLPKCLYCSLLHWTWCTPVESHDWCKERKPTRWGTRSSTASSAPTNFIQSCIPSSDLHCLQQEWPLIQTLPGSWQNVQLLSHLFYTVKLKNYMFEFLCRPQGNLTVWKFKVTVWLQGIIIIFCYNQGSGAHQFLL